MATFDTVFVNTMEKLRFRLVALHLLATLPVVA